MRCKLRKKDTSWLEKNDRNTIIKISNNKRKKIRIKHTPHFLLELYAAVSLIKQINHNKYNQLVEEREGETQSYNEIVQRMRCACVQQREINKTTTVSAILKKNSLRINKLAPKCFRTHTKHHVSFLFFCTIANSISPVQRVYAFVFFFIVD